MMRRSTVEAQGELEQEQLDAAEALVSAGQDFDELEQKTDSKNRRLEARSRHFQGAEKIGFGPYGYDDF